MELTKDNLVLGKENVYFRILLVIAIIFWIMVTVSMIGIPIVAFIAILGWLANGLFIAQLKSDCVLITEKQLPDLYSCYQDVCEKLDLVFEKPKLYVMQSHGLLNAFAIRHAGRDFVVIYSDIVESYGQNSDEIRFILGHEIGHIRRKHINKMLFLAPAMLVPLIGTAYHRACEATCDRFGAFVANNTAGAIRALMILSGGKEAGKLMDPQVFSDQHIQNRGFFVSWYELISGYPTLSQRVANIVDIKENRTPVKTSRHPLAYIFAIFSFGGGGSGGSNLFVTIFMISMLAAIAIPNFLRAKIVANDNVAKMNVEQIFEGVNHFAKDHEGNFPSDISELIDTKLPYIRQGNCGNKMQGFVYECSFKKDDFQITATPMEMGTSGSVIVSATKDGVYVESAFSQAEAQQPQKLMDPVSINKHMNLDYPYIKK